MEGRRKFDATLALTNSVIMATIMSGVLTAVNCGTGFGFAQAWAVNDAVAILVAFPTALVLLPDFGVWSNG